MKKADSRWTLPLQETAFSPWKKETEEPSRCIPGLSLIHTFRQRDIQAFLNKLMGSDDLPDPDFEFDEVAMSAAGELLNQMVHSAAKSVAEYLEHTCLLYTSRCV